MRHALCSCSMSIICAERVECRHVQVVKVKKAENVSDKVNVGFQACEKRKPKTQSPHESSKQCHYLYNYIRSVFSPIYFRSFFCILCLSLVYSTSAFSGPLSNTISTLSTTSLGLYTLPQKRTRLLPATWSPRTLYY